MGFCPSNNGNVEDGGEKKCSPERDACHQPKFTYYVVLQHQFWHV
jgi:hypothetical protein